MHSGIVHKKRALFKKRRMLVRASFCTTLHHSCVLWRGIVTVTRTHTVQERLCTLCISMQLLVQHCSTRAARLLYLDPDSNEVKGEIPIDLNTKRQPSGTCMSMR